MNYFFAIPLFLGVAVVTQGHLNRQISSFWGLPVAVLINASVFLLLSFLFYITSRSLPNLFPDFLQVKSADVRPGLWYLIPGACGFFLVLGLPWAFQNLGSGKTFVLLVSSQILFGIFWDYFISNRELNKAVLIGAVFTIAGSLITILSPK